MMAAGGTCQLYLITPPVFDPVQFADSLNSALDAGPVACLQIRLKDVDDDLICQAAEQLIPVCHRYEVPVLMNDRPDLALSTGCDGVHVGQDDTPYSKARALLGSDAMIGVTCGCSRHLAIEAANAGADYVAFGAFFRTTTKQARVRATPEILSWWSEISVVPSVAIGGITAANCRPLVDAGADFLAVVSGVWDHADGPARVVRAFERVMAGA